MKISGIIGTCRYEITDDAVLVISPISGMTGQISLEITECGWPWNGANIRKVQLSGKIIAEKSIAGMFGGCTQLEDITDLAKMDVSSVENMESMFYSCRSITDISSLADWDVSSVRNMKYMFEYCGSLTDISALSGWNVSSVKTMNSMFSLCEHIEDLSPLTEWDVGNTEDMKTMFYNCVMLRTLNGLSKWDTGNVRCIAHMFSNCGLLTDISALSEWDTGNIVETNGAFCECGLLSDISPLGKWDMKNVIDMTGMFKNCCSLKDISPLTGWNTESAMSVQDIFYNTDITEAGAVRNWNIKSIRSISGMFGKTKAGVNPLEEKIPMACPKTGSFIGWKKCCDGKIVKLLIPEDARRSSSLGKKCRCDKAKVLQVFNWDGTQDVIAKSTYNHHFFYFVGETVSVPNFDTDRFNECAPGIHFFMDRDAAEKYR